PSASWNWARTSSPATRKRTRGGRWRNGGGRPSEGRLPEVAAVDDLDGHGRSVEIVQHPEIDRNAAPGDVEIGFGGLPVVLEGRVIGIVGKGRAAAGRAEIMPVLGRCRR